MNEGDQHHSRAWRVGRWIPTEFERGQLQTEQLTFPEMVQAKVRAVKYVLAALISKDLPSVVDVPEEALDILSGNAQVELKTIGQYIVAGDMERDVEGVPEINPKEDSAYMSVRRRANRHDVQISGLIRVAMKRQKSMPGASVNELKQNGRTSLRSTESAATTETDAKTVKRFVQHFLDGGRTCSGAHRHASSMFWPDAIKRPPHEDDSEGANIDVMLEPPQQDRAMEDVDYARVAAETVEKIRVATEAGRDVASGCKILCRPIASSCKPPSCFSCNFLGLLDSSPDGLAEVAA